MERKSRKIYEYMTIEQKQEALKLLKQDKEELSKEYKKAAKTYPKIVRQVISDTLDKWELEIDELSIDIENGNGILIK
ncbi:hypothetical protein [Savagea faecisuis]|uniref:Uncharacterized protein n=1 Tax=Savagea faecisuis TaxID=1274803 RepID=A0ABW3GUY2_9BACL